VNPECIARFSEPGKRAKRHLSRQVMRRDAASEMPMNAIAEYLGADSLGYLDLDALVRATSLPQNQFCLACFNGQYPAPFDPTLDKHIMERRQNREGTLAQEPDTQPSLFALA
jgi:amidophosphoribosyltransferase